MYRNDWIRLIRVLSARYGVDPQAALAVASSEGLSGGVGDGGHAFGPFQLNDAGGVITGRPGDHRAFAESRAGIDYALRQIAGVAKGLHGQAAVEAIVRRFERPADPSGEITRALGALGQFAGGTPAGAPPSPAGSAPFASSVASQIPSHVLASVNQALAGQTTDAPMPAPLAPLKLPAFVSKAPGAPPSAQPGQPGVRPSATAAPGDYTPGGGKPGQVEPALLSLAKRFGLQITSGFRSVAEQASIYAHRSGPGSVAAPGKSWHQFGRAIDVAPGNIQPLIAYVHAHPSQFKEFFYDPLGWYVKNGQIVRGAIGGHSDHAHVAI